MSFLSIYSFAKHFIQTINLFGLQMLTSYSSDLPIFESANWLDFLDTLVTIYCLTPMCLHVSIFVNAAEVFFVDSRNVIDTLSAVVIVLCPIVTHFLHYHVDDLDICI